MLNLIKNLKKKEIKKKYSLKKLPIINKSKKQILEELHKKKKKRNYLRLKIQKKKLNRIVRVYAQFTKQNSIFTMTDLKGNIKCTVSNGSVGYQNSKSKTKYASQAAASTLGNKIVQLNFKYIIFLIKGRNKGRKRCVKLFTKLGLKIVKIIDKTPISHNGCRPTKLPRR